MDEADQCSKRVFTGSRVDFGGYMCRRKATVSEGGKRWCKQHPPSKVKARDNARQKKHDREDAIRKLGYDLSDAAAAIVDLVVHPTEHSTERLAKARDDYLAIEARLDEARAEVTK
jgi:hypothetical protein